MSNYQDLEAAKDGSVKARYKLIGQIVSLTRSRGVFISGNSIRVCLKTKFECLIKLALFRFKSALISSKN